jgi:RND family efflux transporter MFP subunit
MKLISLIIVFMVSSIICIVYTGCTEKEAPPEIIRPVKYEQVYATGGKRDRSFSGVAQAGLESKLSFKVSGTLEKINVKVGDRIQAGSVIARLEATDFNIQVQQAEAALVQAKAQERNANASYERAMTLYEDRNISKSEFDAARAAAESARAAVKSTDRQLELARRQLNYAVLKAPVDGSIASVPVEENENVQAGQTIVRLTSGSQIEVQLSIPEVLIAEIEEGSKVTVRFDAVPDKEFTATVTEVGVAATGMATTFPVTVKLDRSEPEVRPGMAASVTFRFGSLDDRKCFILPTHAVSEDQNGRFVYVVEPITGEAGMGEVHRKSVTIGDLTRDGLEVLDGISDGDRVITAGISRISPGMKVKM